jgi:dihydroorotate dehydrogenase
MPDWFYRTVSRPLLFRLPAQAARAFALGLMGRLARLPGGPALIDLLGHMRPDPRLRCSFLGLSLPSAIGLGPALDGNAVALPALARFGLGFLEVGPVTPEPHRPSPPVERRAAEEALWLPDPPPSLGLEELRRKLARSTLGVPLVVRLGYAPGAGPEQAGADCRRLIEGLSPHAAAFSLTVPPPALQGGWSDASWVEYVRNAVAAAAPRALLLCVPADLDAAAVDRLLGAARVAGVGAVVVDGSVQAKPAGRLVGLPAREAALGQVRHLRDRWGAALVIVAAGGAHEPADALELRAAGADLVQLDSGLVYTGPGLPKRVNDALLYAEARPAPRPADGEAAERPSERSWFWAALMGAGMLFGSVLALAIAATRVVLPYDEALAGMSRDKLAAVNPRLLAFMAHDRVSLAGTMIAIGVLYLGLSLGGLRRGLHWAKAAVCASAFTGFGSFFLFLCFGYFDPFHAFVTAVLFQFLLLALHCRLGQPAPAAPPLLRADRAWLCNQWGQFLFVLQGCGLIGAGLAITTIGATSVFVPEDLEFMRTTAQELQSANPRLVPLIAHDRATFGGMLIAGGLVVLLTALWGFRPGDRWLWWTLLAAGPPAYAAAIGVHLVVHYTNLRHLAPPAAGAALFVLGLALSYPSLCRPSPANEAAWRRLGRRP